MHGGTAPCGRRDRGADPEKRIVRAAGTDTAVGSSPGAEPPAAGPAVLGRYRLTRRLGAGAFGTVWQARDERLERDVAVKILPRERIMGGRFEREAKAAARLTHPGIVMLYEAAVDDEGAYLVSELVRGATLAQLLGAGRLSDRDIVMIGIALCDALEHAHAQGVVHRDVKPSNILVPGRAATPGQQAKLTDFGVARVVGGDALTRTGDVVGTMAYMAPEQAEGREVGEAADLYSLALVLYEALTGVNPVLTGTVAVRARRLGAYLPPLRRQRRDLPRELGRGIDLALRPRPRERGTIGALKTALVECAELVDDQPGIVDGPWTAALTRAADGLAEHARPQGPDETPVPPAAVAAGLGGGAAVAGWSARAAGALVAAGLSAWVVATPLHPAPLAPAAAALLAGLAVLALPRLGWLGLLLASSLVAVTQGRPGLAVLIATAGLMPVTLMPRHGRAWPLVAVCPVLGLVGLAGVWPALAARARSLYGRAALAAAGWTWLLLAAPLSGRALYMRTPPAPGRWTASAALALQHVLAPLASPRLLAPCAVWAAGAALLPLLRRPYRPVFLNLAVVLAWAGAVALAAAAAPALLGGGRGLVFAGQVALGALASVVVALAPEITRHRRRPSAPADAVVHVP
jgi:serine/threonine protein kinase